MTLRRGAPIKPSMGTVWPPKVRDAIRYRDKSCIGARIGMPYVCAGEAQIDHVRASHGMGMKSESTVRNGALLCFVHHRVKTEAGRLWRPKLITWIDRHPTPEPDDCGHVDPVFGCCDNRVPA